MKVGVFLGAVDPRSGGGFTFERCITKALANLPNSKGFEIIFIAPARPDDLDSTATFQSFTFTGSREESEPEFLALAASLSLEFIVYITPVWITMEIPYLAIVWDLQHRRQPFFPEVSSSPPNQWRARENHYDEYLRRAACIVTGTTTGAKELRLFYQVLPERVKVIPLPTPDDCLDDQESTSTTAGNVSPDIQSEYFFYPAQFWPHKNHANLILALCHLRSQHFLTPGLVLTGADKGNESYVKELVRHSDLERYVHFCGFVSRNEIKRLYRGAVALVYPSLFGPDNLPPLEAMALRCPVLTAKVPGAFEQLDDTALYCDATDPRDIASNMKTLLQDGTVRDRYRGRGLKLAQERTSERYASELAEVLDQFVGVRRTWASGGRFNQIFSGREAETRSEPDHISVPLSEVQKQHRMLEIAAEERLRGMQILEADLIAQQLINQRMKRHWWTALGRRLGVCSLT